MIQGIVGNMSKEWERMIEEKEKYSKIVKKIDPDTVMVN